MLGNVKPGSDGKRPIYVIKYEVKGNHSLIGVRLIADNLVFDLDPLLAVIGMGRLTDKGLWMPRDSYSPPEQIYWKIMSATQLNHEEYRYVTL